MSAEETDTPRVSDAHSPTEPPASGATTTTTTKKRPRLDLDSALFGAGAGAGAGRERKRGKSMFGLVVGTLNRAKIEDRERSASEAAKKRQLIEQRLQNKLKKEVDSVRRAEEAKKDKMAANRKEEELQLKDSIYKFRLTHLPLYANFLLTSDIIPPTEPDDPSSTPTPTPAALANPPRTHPPPLYYLPALLLPSQQAFLARRKLEVSTSTTTEYALFRTERAQGIKDVNELRQRVADEEARIKRSSDPAGEMERAAVGESAMDVDVDVDVLKEGENEKEKEKSTTETDDPKPSETEHEAEKKEEAVQGDDDDAVEY